MGVSILNKRTEALLEGCKEKINDAPHRVIRPPTDSEYRK